MTPEQLAPRSGPAWPGRRRRRPRRRRPGRRPGRAAAQPRARRLVDQRRPAAGQAGRRAAAGGRDAARRPPRRRSPGSRASTSPVRASSTSSSTPPRRASWPARSSRPGRRTGARTPRPAHRINLEFVSANPTGPIHLGGTRWAAVGDALARILQATGADGHAGVLLQRPRRADRPVRPRRCWPRPRASRRPRTATAAPTSATSPRGVAGATEPGRSSTCRTTRRRRSSARAGVDLMFAEIKASLHDFGVDFDVYFHENDAARVRGGRARRRPAARAGPHLRGGRRASGCAPPTSATTRTGSSSRATASRPTSPATWPTTSTSASAASTGCVIMLGADHHGYVGRLMAMCAGVRRHPAREPRDPDRPDGQPGQGRPAGADEQAGRHRRDDGGPGRGRRRRRRPLRAGPLLGRLADRHRPRPAGQAQQRQPGLLRAVRARPARRHRPRLPPRTACGRDDGVRPVAARPRRPRRRCWRRSGEFPRVVAQAAELREPHRVARYLEELAGTYHKWYDDCRVRPDGATRRSPTCTAPGSGSTRPPARCSPTASACSASPRRSGCSACARTRPARCTPRATGGPSLAAAAGRRQRRWSRRCGRVTSAAASDGALTRRRASTSATSRASYGTPAYVVDEDDFRGAGRGLPRRVRRGVRRPVRRRRRLLRRQGVPVHRGRPLGAPTRA